MASMVGRMLDQADDLIGRYPSSRAARRRAVSSAYYAAFHGLMYICATALLPDADRASDEFDRVYRSLEHGSMKSVFKAKTFQADPELQLIGDLVVGLQSARMLADYSPPERHGLTLSKARQHIEEARRAVDRLAKLDNTARQTLAVHLLFRKRPAD